jgi:hypothetical protein
MDSLLSIITISSNFEILKSFIPNDWHDDREHNKRQRPMTMVMMATAPTLFRPRKHMECYASENLHNEWRSCYLKAMGLQEEDWVDSGKETSTTTASRPDMILTNLLPHNNNNEEDEEDAKEEESVPDPWTLTARSMQTSIFEMAAWIHTKKMDYVSVYMSDDEASLIQSTVTSFIATTANEIEGLRQSLLSDANSATSSMDTNASTSTSTRHQHKTGIVQILLTLLQLEIAQPFRAWQKQRHRAAVQLWQNPYSCTLVTASQQQHAAAHRRGKSSNKQTTAHDQELDAALGLDDDDGMDHADHVKAEQRFLPRRPSHRLQHDFLAAYYPNDNIDDNACLQRPVSLLNRRKRPKSTSPATSPSATPSKDAKRSKTGSFASKKQEQTKQRQQAKRSYFGASNDDNGMDDGDNDDQHGQAQQLQQEALVLKATVESDLDNVQKMEQMMVDITALLGQFSNLVSEQQEDVWEIHDAVAQTKDNMQKGQENLVDAAERTKKSKHWTPAIVTCAGSLLLLFHWLRA